MAVGIICITDLSMSPYVWFYADICKKHNMEYVVITKANQKIAYNGYNVETYVVSESELKKNRVIRVYNWFKWLKQKSKKLCITKYIVTPTNTAFLLAPFLLTTSIPYLVDVRDYLNEEKPFVRALEKIIFSRSKLVVISSEGFKKWLPSVHVPVYTIHNMPLDAEKCLVSDWSSENRRIVIGYIGYVNYYQINTRLIDILHGNPRYALQYSGKIASSCPLQDYVGVDEADVIFTGPYSNVDKAGLYKQIDMINAVYGSESLLVTTALPNKLYDAILYRKPIIAAKGTFLAEIVEAEGIGLAVDIDKDDIISKLDNYWDHFNRNTFEYNCSRFYKKVEDEQNSTIGRIVDFIT